MIKKYISQLFNRSIISVSGSESRNFLQGLISNDINLVDSEKMIFSGMFNPQGKFFSDFFIFQPDKKNLDILYIDSNSNQTDDIITKLNTYKLRSKIDIKEISDKFSFFSFININKQIFLENDKNNLLKNCIIHNDPRLEKLGKKIYVPKELEERFINQFSNFFKKDFYEINRIQLGIPDGVSDIIPNKDFPLDFGYDQLNAISFSKGCYIGQEITARTHNRAKLKKKIFLVKSEQKLPDFNSQIYYKGNKVGKMLSKLCGTGIALLDKSLTEECIKNKEFLESDNIKITPYITSWN